MNAARVVGVVVSFVLLLACASGPAPAARVNDPASPQTSQTSQTSPAVAGLPLPPSAAEDAPTQRPSGWAPPEPLVRGSAFHGVHGVAVDSRARLLVGTLVGHAIWQVDRSNGAARVLVPAPQGEADDLAIGPRGELAWTSRLQGVVRYRADDLAPIREVAKNLPGISSLAFDKQSGALYASQAFQADALWQIDVDGLRAPRLIARDLGGLDGFDVGRDGLLYGPLWFKGQVVRIDPANGHLSVLNGEFGTPAAANLDGQGNLWVLDTKLGMLSKVELATGKKTDVRKLATSLDNLAFAPDGSMYITNMADNSVQLFDPARSLLRDLTRGQLAAPGGIALDGDNLYVADVFAFRAIDRRSGAVRDVQRAHAAGSKLEYPGAVGVGGKWIALTSSLTGSIQLLDRSTLRDVAVIHGLIRPSHALPLDDGSLLVVDLGGALFRLFGAQFTRRAPIASGLVGPIQMLVGRDGGVYVSESIGRITRVEPATGAKRVVADQLAGPESLAETPWGSLIVAEAQARRVTEIALRDGARRPVADNLPIGLAGMDGKVASALPTGLAIDREGTIFVSCDVDNSLLAIRPRR